MSRSNQTELINPARFFYEWSGSEGKIKYYDKEKKEQVFLKLPFSFLVLDRLSTIKGFSDSHQSGFWSNEIRDIKKEKFNVRTKNGLVASDLYGNLAHVLNQGAAYCQSVYIAIKDEKGELIIANFQIHGSAIGQWIELCKGKNIYKFAVSIVKAAPMKKGKTNYFVPMFEVSKEISEETETKAVELDKQLQEYLTAYFGRSKPDTEAPEEVVTDRQKAESFEEVNTQLTQDAENFEQSLPF